MRAEAAYRLEVTTSGFWRQPHAVPEGLVLSLDERLAFYGSATVRALFDGRFSPRSKELTELSLLGLVDD